MLMTHNARTTDRNRITTFFLTNSSYWDCGTDLLRSETLPMRSGSHMYRLQGFIPSTFILLFISLEVIGTFAMAIMSSECVPMRSGTNLHVRISPS